MKTLSSPMRDQAPRQRLIISVRHSSADTIADAVIFICTLVIVGMFLAGVLS